MMSFVEMHRPSGPITQLPVFSLVALIVLTSPCVLCFCPIFQYLSDYYVEIDRILGEKWVSCSIFKAGHSLRQTSLNQLSHYLLRVHARSGW